jgi:hypothetical protein
VPTKAAQARIGSAIGTNRIPFRSCSPPEDLKPKRSYAATEFGDALTVTVEASGFRSRHISTALVTSSRPIPRRYIEPVTNSIDI